MNPLLQMNNQEPQMDQEDPEMDDTYEDEDEALIGQAFESDEFNDVGIGVEIASEEEHMILEAIMDGIEDVMHGAQSDKLVKLMRSAKEPFEGIGMAAHALALSAYMQANKQGIEPEPDIFLAENGVLQETTELLWEMADAINIVNIDDEEQLNATYLNAVRLMGESILEMDNPMPVQSAQEFLLELELGHEVNSEDYMQEEQMMQDGQMPPEQGMAGGPEMMPQNQNVPMAPQAPTQQAPMPPTDQGY